MSPQPGKYRLSEIYVDVVKAEEYKLLTNPIGTVFLLSKYYINMTQMLGNSVIYLPEIRYISRDRVNGEI